MLVEIVWIGVGTVLLALAIANILDANKDLRALEVLKRNGTLRSIAVHGQIIESLRVIMALAGIAIGVAGLVSPNESITDSHPYVVVSVTVIYICLGVQIIRSRQLRTRLQEEVSNE